MLSWVLNLGFSASGTPDAPVVPSGDKSGKLLIVMVGLLRAML